MPTPRLVKLEAVKQLLPVRSDKRVDSKNLNEKELEHESESPVLPTLNHNNSTIDSMCSDNSAALREGGALRAMPAMMRMPAVNVAMFFGFRRIQ